MALETHEHPSSLFQWRNRNFFFGLYPCGLGLHPGGLGLTVSPGESDETMYKANLNFHAQ